MATPFEAEKSRSFIVVSRDFSGLGLAKRLADEGQRVILAHDLVEDMQKEPGGKLIGKHIVDMAPLSEVWGRRKSLKNAYWIFDQNHEGTHYGDILRKEGFPRVIGGGELTYRMEHEREFGVSMVKRAGMQCPPTFEFTTPEDGIRHLDENEEKAYVFKPNSDDAGWETYVPDSMKDPMANAELHAYLDSLPNGNSAGYILQERIKGVEANFEVWLHKGKPFFAFCELECKRKSNDDLGGLVGGAQDINFAIPIESKAIRETVGRIIALPEFKDFTGFVDANVIISDNGPYFLEFCARFGYPSHPTLLLQLPKIAVADVLAKMLDGDTEKFYDHFRYGFAAGITLNCEKPRKGLPLFLPEDIKEKFYLYDVYKRGDVMLTAGLGLEIGVMTAHGFTIMDAAELAVDRAKKVAFPSRGMRTDLARDDYDSNPRDRYLALEAMRYLT